MRKIRKPVLFMTFMLIFSLLSFGPAQTEMAQAGALAGTVTYNLFATDGYIELADSTPLYMYGFVGGRAGLPFTYESSFCTFDGASRNCTPPVNMPGTAITPTGGPINTQTGEDLLAGNAQFPAPLIYASVGDVVVINLKNLGVSANPYAPNDPHSIHLHGMDVDAANDGVPETSVGAVPANLCEDGTSVFPGTTCETPAPGAGNVIVYMFTPTNPGTYMYHCHQEADIHVNMGMYGALVVYNPTDQSALTGPGVATGGGGNLYGFQYDKDYVMLLSEVDIRGHADEEGVYGSEAPNGTLLPANLWDVDPYNWAHYKPQYWFVNGLSFPQTIHAGSPSGYTFADWLAAHPGYDPLITGSVSTPNAFWGTPGQKVLIRVINMGFETQPMHMHGYHGKILGSDQRAWSWANYPKSKINKMAQPFGQGLEKQTLTIGSGETYEWLVDFGQQMLTSTYPAGGTESCYDPATNLPVANAAGCTPIPDAGAEDGPPYIGGPTVAGLVDILTGGTPLDPANNFPATPVSQYFPFHNHDDYKATNNGVYPGGMFTMLVPTP